MKIARFRQPALSAMAVLMISGAGIAFAADPSASPSGPPAVEATESGGAAADTDTQQLGDQTTLDSQADEAAEAAGSETEKAGLEEPGDENLPGGGHADDPNDPNADHQFEGVE